MAMATNHEEIPPSQEDLHRSRPYHPSLWGDFFLDHTPCTPAQYLAMKDDAEVKKEELRKMILDSRSSDLPHKLELVDTLERLGLEYHYKKEIDNLLQDIHGARDQDCDLPTTALRFYLLRKHGYHISSDVFLKFKDIQGNIASNDTRCLLSLYDAAHLRIRGEEILDNAIAFTKDRLHTMIEYLEPELAKEVHHALETPLFRRIERVEARRCISLYEKNTTRNETMLELAKLDFNILLTLYCKELKDLTLWWKEFQAQTNIKHFARDRMVELHFWTLGVFYEPQYSYSRIMLTKLVTIVSLFDDLYDNYSTTEESYFFTTALERWDDQATEQLPTYLRTLYIKVFTTVNAIEQELKLQNNKYAELVKNVVIHMAKSYHAEGKWRDEHYVPANIEEHLQISVRSSACMQITNLAFISMGEVATIEAIEWAFTYPKIIKAVCIIGRIRNDIMSHQREQASKHVVSTVQTCMKEYGITEQQANERLEGLVEEAWMDITEACLRPEQPPALLERVVNLARTMDLFYKHEDAYTVTHSLKATMDSVYVDLI